MFQDSFSEGLLYPGRTLAIVVAAIVAALLIAQTI